MVQENLRQLTINALRVGNFKAFSNTQYIPIRPLTLIYGGNSSGKSSILHSLLFAHHVIKNDGELDVYRTEAGGNSVDLGGFGQYVHRRDRSSVVEWAVDINAQILNTEILRQVEQFTVGVTLGLGIENKGIKVRSFFLKADGQAIADMSARRDGLLRLDRLNLQHPVVKLIIDEIMEATASDTREDVEAFINKEVVPETVAKLAHLFPREIEIAEEKSSSKFDSTIVSSRLNQIIGEVVRAIENDLGRLRYLGPLRTYPPRHFAFSRQQDENWYSGGGYAWDLLLTNSEVCQKVNHWLGSEDRMKTPYELIVRNLLSDRELTNRLDYLISEGYEKLAQELIVYFYDGNIYEKYQELEDLVWSDSSTKFKELISQLTDVNTLPETWVKEMISEGESISDLILIDKRTQTSVTHRDVGVGVSQVIPILVYCYGLSNGLVAIEQPEIHLHPKLQAELGDVFIESALGEQKNCFILETHSEHLLLRIMRRMRQTVSDELPEGVPPVKPEDVSLLFVNPDEDGSIVMEIPLSKKGELKKSWPGGFFEEGLEEVFK